VDKVVQPFEAAGISNITVIDVRAMDGDHGQGRDDDDRYRGTYLWIGIGVMLEGALRVYGLEIKCLAAPRSPLHSSATDGSLTQGATATQGAIANRCQTLPFRALKNFYEATRASQHSPRLAMVAFRPDFASSGSVG
jgi:hypothetical protein